MTSAGGTARWIAGDLESWFLKINDKDYKSAGVSGGIRMTLSHDSAGPDNCTGRNVAINDVTPTTTDRSTTSPRISWTAASQTINLLPRRMHSVAGILENQSIPIFRCVIYKIHVCEKWVDCWNKIWIPLCILWEGISASATGATWMDTCNTCASRSLFLLRFIGQNCNSFHQDVCISGLAACHVLATWAPRARCEDADYWCPVEWLLMNGLIKGCFSFMHGNVA